MHVNYCIYSTLKFYEVMKKIIFLLILLFSIASTYSQHTLNAVIKDSKTRLPLVGAIVSLKNINKTSLTNENGIVQFVNIPTSKQVLVITHTGYKTLNDTLVFPQTINGATEFFLTAEEEEIEEVIVQSTRTSRTINNTPTRIETIDGEEVEEKSNMRPANVSMLLHESTGLQVQQTSATSGNASIRMQGLDGRYTQLLKDGYANFGNFASGLSILEIPPLDLKQVEIIKGPASTLYGGGAIAGVVNFISKTPKENGEYNFILNQSNVGQTNLGAYASNKKNKWGYTVLGLLNLQKAYDVDKDDFSELPKANSFTINPRLFYYPNKSTTLMVGNSFTIANNMGGDMQVIHDKATASHVYFEQNKTIRNTTTFEFDKKFVNKNSFKLKQSISVFDRKIGIPNYEFSGINTNSFTDVSFSFNKVKHTTIAGLNVVLDKFKQRNAIPILDQTAQTFTTGLYVQDTWDASNKIKIETGLRLDNALFKNILYSKNQTFVLPRISVLYKINNKFSSRIGGGLGYKVPTVFTEQTETIQYQQVLPLNNVTAEKSIGGTVDVNFKSKIATDFLLSVNQLFFYTNIYNPLVLQLNGVSSLAFANAAKPIVTKGFETNVKLIFKENYKFFVGYTYIDAKANYMAQNQFLPLLPKHKLNLTLLYEKENNFKIGLEGYFTDKQFLYSGLTTSPFWEFGLMGEKVFNKLTVFVNFENFTDQRQSKYKQVVNPPHTNPTFDDVWNHLEGFVVNGGIKIKL